MAAKARTLELLEELEAIDQREDRILEVLLQHGTRLEHRVDEADRRARVVTVADLQALAGALTSVQTAIGDVQAQIVRATLPPSSASNGTAQPATFDALAASLRAQDAEADRLRALLRERLLALKAQTNGGAPSDPHPAVPNGAGLRTFRLTKPPMSGGDVTAFQRELNRRFEAWGMHTRIAENGIYGRQTRQAARQVARGLGIAAADCEHGITPAVRTLIRTPSRRTAQQLELARQRRDWLRRLRKHHTAAPGAKRVTPAPAPGMAAAIRAAGGRYETVILREAKRSKLPVSLVCAVIEKETHFRNVFGHDGGPRHTNPVKSPPRGLLAVNEERYREYLRHRNLGRGQQGIGPMQLTSGDLQDRADRFGGCWRVGPNIRVGCEHLAAKIAARGLQGGVQAYNGAAGNAYSTSVLALERAWRARLPAARPAAGPKPAPRGPKTMRGGGALRLRAHAEARKLIGVMEVGGNNRGKTVMAIIRANGGPGPEPWCGDFVAWCYRKAGSKSVTRGWAAVRQYLPLTGLKRTKQPLKGDLVRFTFDHIGMFVCWCDARGREVSPAKATHIRTIEGNTGRSGAVSDSRTGGDGVYEKLRARRLVKDFIHVKR